MDASEQTPPSLPEFVILSNKLRDSISNISSSMSSIAISLGNIDGNVLPEKPCPEYKINNNLADALINQNDRLDWIDERLREMSEKMFKHFG